MSLFSTGGGHFIPRVVINLLDMLCISIYLLDIVLRLVVNNGQNRAKHLLIYKDNWLLLRLLCAAVLLVDSVVFLTSPQPIRFTQALIPVIYITRRNSLRQMVHGLVNAFVKSFSLLSFLLLVHLLWSYFGFVLFRGVPVEGDNRFVDFPTSLLTVLQCATSRSYSLFALVPYYEVNPTASLFFLALTIAADLICINLIVAVGNRQYRLFSTLLFKRQLRNRRQAFVAIHALLSDDKGFVSRETWLEFCSHIQGKYSVTREAADLLFSLECEGSCDKVGFDCVDCVGFFRLSALLSARVDIDKEKVPWHMLESAAEGGAGAGGGLMNPKDLSEEGEVGRTVRALTKDNLSGRERVSSVLEGEEKEGEGVTGEAPCRGHPLIHSLLSGENSLVPSAAAATTVADTVIGKEAWEREGVVCRMDRAFSDPSLSPMLAPLLGLDAQTIRRTRSISSNDLHFNSPERNKQVPVLHHWRMDTLPSRWEIKPRADMALLSDIDHTDMNNIDELELLSATTRSHVSPWMHILYWLRLMAARMIKYTIPSSHLLPRLPPTITRLLPAVCSPYGSFFFLIKVLLAIQLVFLSRRQNTLAWIRLGWVLEAFLWMEMLLLMFAWGVDVYFRRGGFGYITSLNVITLIVMILVGSNSNETFSLSYFLLLIFQSCRFVVFFRYLAGADLFLALVPLLLRVLFLIFCVIYFFAVLGHTRLCHAFNASNIDTGADDDAFMWLPFEHMFNFNSMLQTMYTLFYVMMLGNWTWIMDAAACTERIPSLLYFYSFRLLMTLVVIPIMFAFIIQSFICKRDHEEASRSSCESIGTAGSLPPTNHCVVSDTVSHKPKVAVAASGVSPGGAGGGDGEAAIHRALQRVASKRNLSLSPSKPYPPAPSPALEIAHGSPGHRSNVIRSEKDILRMWKLGRLSVQTMFEAYAMGVLFPAREVDCSAADATSKPPSRQCLRVSGGCDSPPIVTRSISEGGGGISSWGGSGGHSTLRKGAYQVLSVACHILLLILHVLQPVTSRCWLCDKAAAITHCVACACV